MMKLAFFLLTLLSAVQSKSIVGRKRLQGVSNVGRTNGKATAEKESFLGALRVQMIEEQMLEEDGFWTRQLQNSMSTNTASGGGGGSSGAVDTGDGATGGGATTTDGGATTTGGDGGATTTDSSTEDASAASDDDDGLSMTAIIGIAAGGGGALGVLILFMAWANSRPKKGGY